LTVSDRELWTSILDPLWDVPDSNADTAQSCSRCHITWDEIRSRGLAVCPDCFESFRDRLLLLRRCAAPSRLAWPAWREPVSPSQDSVYALPPVKHSPYPGIMGLRFELRRNFREYPFMSSLDERSGTSPLLGLAAVLDRVVPACCGPDLTVHHALALPPASRQGLLAEQHPADWWTAHLASMRFYVPPKGQDNGLMVLANTTAHLVLRYIAQADSAGNYPETSCADSFTRLFACSTGLEDAAGTEQLGYAWNPAFGYLDQQVVECGALSLALFFVLMPPWHQGLQDLTEMQAYFSEIALLLRLVVSIERCQGSRFSVFAFRLMPTPGSSEEVLVNAFGAFAQTVLDYQKKLVATRLLDTALTDKVYRALATLRYARLLALHEEAECIALLCEAWVLGLLGDELVALPLHAGGESPTMNEDRALAWRTVMEQLRRK